MLRVKNWRIQVKRCDNCGAFNPALFDNNPRLCGECAEPRGFYKKLGEKDINAIGANGKINWWSLQLPIKIYFRGWWRL